MSFKNHNVIYSGFFTIPCTEEQGRVAEAVIKAIRNNASEARDLLFKHVEPAKDNPYQQLLAILDLSDAIDATDSDDSHLSKDLLGFYAHLELNHSSSGPTHNLVVVEESRFDEINAANFTQAFLKVFNLPDMVQFQTSSHAANEAPNSTDGYACSVTKEKIQLYALSHLLHQDKSAHDKKRKFYLVQSNDKALHLEYRDSGELPVNTDALSFEEISPNTYQVISVYIPTPQDIPL